MTREEAIRIIKIVLAVAEEFEITVQGEEFTEEKCKEAVEIATEALSSSEKPNKWIPVSERLPETVLDEFNIQCSEDVLVYDGADLRVGYFMENNKHDFNYWVVYGDYCFRPIAWMPLPEPYKASPTGAEKESDKE